MVALFSLPLFFQGNPRYLVGPKKFHLSVELNQGPFDGQADVLTIVVPINKFIYLSHVWVYLYVYTNVVFFPLRGLIFVLFLFVFCGHSYSCFVYHSLSIC